jgi:uncharacterized protein involved in exopolysaccharide biosynthesis
VTTTVTPAPTQTAEDDSVPRASTQAPGVTLQPSASLADDVVRAVIRNWHIVALTAAATMLLAWLFAAVQPKRYRVTAIGAVAPMVEGMAPTDVIRGVDSLERRVVISTVAALASSPTIRKQATGPLHGYAINSSVVPNTNLFNITVEGENAAQVAAIANRVPSLVAPQAAAMYKLFRVTLISPATTPSEPVLPRASRAAIAGLMLGVLLGVALAWFIDQRHKLPFLTRAAAG